MMEAMLIGGSSEPPIMVTTSNEGSINAFDMSDGSAIAIPAGITSTFAAFAPDGQHLFATSNESNTAYIRCYDSSTWQQTMAPVQIAPTNATVEDMRVSPDGGSVIVVASQRGVLMSTSDWTPIPIPGFPATGDFSADFSPDGSILAVGISVAPFVRLYSTTNWTQLSSPTGISATVRSIRFTPDGGHLLVAGGRRLVALRTSDWSIAAQINLPISHDIRTIAIRPDGEQIALGVIGSSNTAPLWIYDFDGSTLIRSPAAPIGGSMSQPPSIAFSPDGDYFSLTTNHAPSFTTVWAKHEGPAPAALIAQDLGLITCTVFSGR